MCRDIRVGSRPPPPRQLSRSPTFPHNFNFNCCSEKFFWTSNFNFLLHLITFSCLVVVFCGGSGSNIFFRFRSKKSFFFCPDHDRQRDRLSLVRKESPFPGLGVAPNSELDLVTKIKILPRLRILVP